MLRRFAVLMLPFLAACVRPSAVVTAPGAAPGDSARFERWIAAHLDPPRPAQPSPDAWLDTYDVAAERRAAERAAGRLAELLAIDTSALGVPQRIDWLLAEAALKRVIHDTVLHQLERSPGRYLTLGDLYWRVAGDRPPGAEDWAGIRRDLERAPRVMGVGRRQLRSPPPLWVQLATATARSYAGFLAGEFETRAAQAPDSLREAVLAAGRTARLALESYAAFLEDTLRAGADNSWASGERYYDWVLRETFMLPFTASSMIDAGRRIHDATRAALDSAARALRPGTPWRALADEMRTRHPAPGQITDAYRRHSRLVQSLLIRDNLVRLPPCEELAFVPTPPQLRQTYAWGGYGGITMRGNVMTGRFFVTEVVPGMTTADSAEKLRTQNNGWVSVIALHEGYPGHHLQQVYTRLNPRPLRRRSSDTYYGEGWALYAEHWMARAGLFEGNPDGQLGQLQMRLWRTARVIIDPSLHTGRMTYQEAVAFFMQEVGLERSAAEAEVNRFTTWPTQAPSYIIGWLEIERLKADVMRALGERFSEKDFVERVLEAGPLPLALLRRAVLHAYGIN